GFLEEISAPGSFEPTGVAIDEASGALYAIDAAGGVVDVFSTSGEPEGELEVEGGGEPFAFSAPRGIAGQNTGPTRREGYLPAGVLVDVFGAAGPPVVLPKASYGAPTELTPSSVTLHGEADPNGGGEITACSFEWGETASYGEAALCEPP